MARSAPSGGSDVSMWREHSPSVRLLVPLFGKKRGKKRRKVARSPNRVAELFGKLPRGISRRKGEIFQTAKRRNGRLQTAKLPNCRTADWLDQQTESASGTLSFTSAGASAPRESKRPRHDPSTTAMVSHARGGYPRCPLAPAGVPPAGVPPARAATPPRDDHGALG